MEVAPAIAAVGEVFPADRVDGGPQHASGGEGGERRPGVGGDIVSGEADGPIPLVAVEDAAQVTEPSPPLEIEGRRSQGSDRRGRRVEADKAGAGDKIEELHAVAGDIAGAEPQRVRTGRPGVRGDVVDAEGRTVLPVGRVDLAVQQGRPAIVPREEGGASEQLPSVAGDVIPVE